jgi:hypothetical protein
MMRVIAEHPASPRRGLESHGPSRMEDPVERITAPKDKGNLVLPVGDRDVDGIMSTTLLERPGPVKN